MNLEEYYQDYWQKRLSQNDSLGPIRDFIPDFLKRFSQYGSILNQVPAGSKLLDLGCGQGKVSALFLRFKGCRVTGLDISQNAVAEAKEKGINATRFDLNSDALPFDNNSFDCVTIIDVLEHVLNPIALLGEARRVLVPGGRLIVSVPNFARWDNRFRMLLGKPQDILHWRGYGDGVEHLHWFTKSKLIDFLQKAGFEKNRFVAVGLPFDFLFGLIGLSNLARILTSVSIKK